MTTITHIAKSQDSRCAWWQAIIPDSLNVINLDDEKVKLNYLRRGADLELEPGTLLIDSEAMHHRKSRGYAVNIGMAFDDRVHWFSPTLKHKLYIKEKGKKELMKGSGDVAAVWRIALYLRSLTEDERIEEFKKLEAL